MFPDDKYYMKVFNRTKGEARIIARDAVPTGYYLFRCGGWEISDEIIYLN